MQVRGSDSSKNYGLQEAEFPAFLCVDLINHRYILRAAMM